MKHILISLCLFLVSTAILHAAQNPVPGRLDPRVTTVIYQSNNVLKVKATHGISTAIIFEEDERLETIALGDTESWQVTPNERKNILFVKPVANNVPTNMNIVTNKRMYFIELVDNKPSAEKQVFGVRFIYPDNAATSAMRKEAEYRAANPNISKIEKENVNLDYSFSGSQSIKPTMIFDDGNKTYLKFKGKIPAIFSVNSDYSESLVNFRKEGEYIVIDSTATQYTLRDGTTWTCIFNLRKPDFAAPNPYILAPKNETSTSKRRGSGN